MTKEEIEFTLYSTSAGGNTSHLFPQPTKIKQNAKNISLQSFQIGIQSINISLQSLVRAKGANIHE
jgi:hypothetical protein